MKKDGKKEDEKGHWRQMQLALVPVHNSFSL